MQQKKGTVAECLEDFSTQLSAVPNFYQARNAICETLSINIVTGRDWFTKRILPKGVNLMGLQLLLDVAGYTVVERDKLPFDARQCADALAFRLVPLVEVAGILGIKPDSVLRILLGRSAIMDQYLKPLKDLSNRYFNEVLDKRHYLVTLLQQYGLRQDVSAPSKALGHSAKLPEGMSASHVVEALSHLIQAALPLADFLDTQADPKDRELLRTSTAKGHSNAVFQLANILNHLCSERARGLK